MSLDSTLSNSSARLASTGSAGRALHSHLIPTEPWMSVPSPRLLVTSLLTALILAGCTKQPSPPEAAPTTGAAAEKEAPAENVPHVLELTPEQTKVAGIATALVEERAAGVPIQATATIEPVADRQARVGSRVQGRITALRAKVGDRVRAGQALAILDSPDLGRARADYLAALAGANLARETANREKALFERNISAEREWREAEAQAVKARADKEAAENRLHGLGVTDAELPDMRVDRHLGSTMALTSPIDGLVVEAGATLGQMVEPKDTLFTVMDLRTVWLQVDVYEQDLAEVRPGQRAAVVLKAAPGETFSGYVENVGALVDPRTRTVKVRVALENARGVLRPGMFATATIEGTTGERRRGLYVPTAAVQRLGRDRVVFVPKSEGRYEARAVEVSRDAAGWAEVTRGLSAGERIVTAGSFALKSELKKDELGGEE